MISGSIYCLAVCSSALFLGGVVLCCTQYLKFSSNLGYMKNKVYGNYIRKKERKVIEKQLPEVVDMMRNGLRAGFGLQQIFVCISEQAPSPIKKIFESLVHQLRLGRDFDELLVELKNRLKIRDLTLLIDSILILKKTGGNLVSKFESIAEVMRSRQRIKMKIDLLVSQGKYQCITIMIMPFALMFALSFVADWYVKPLFTTYLGWVAIALMILLQCAGGFWMKKIISIRV